MPWPSCQVLTQSSNLIIFDINALFYLLGFKSRQFDESWNEKDQSYTLAGENKSSIHTLMLTYVPL